MDKIRIVIPSVGVVKNNKRAWFNPETKRMHHYYKNEKGIKDFENAIREEAAKVCTGPWDGPIGIDMFFIFPRPKGKLWKTKPMPREWKDVRPDYENLMKPVTDALNKIAFRDDGQVAKWSGMKLIGDANDTPHTIIDVYRLESYITP